MPANIGLITRILSAISHGVGVPADFLVKHLLSGGTSLGETMGKGLLHVGMELPGAATGLASEAAGLGAKGLGWLGGKGSQGEHLLGRRLAALPLAYYGGEAVSAPFSSNDTMQKMRENYWDSVAAGAGDQTASPAARTRDWLTTPVRAFLAGGETNSAVPNQLHGEADRLFKSLGAQPGRYIPGQGATNETLLGTRQAPLSNYQKAMQALALQAERKRNTQLSEAVAKDQPMQRAASQAQQKYQQAFPNAKIPGVGPAPEPSFSRLLGQGAAEAAGEEAASKTPGRTIGDRLQATLQAWQ